MKSSVTVSIVSHGHGDMVWSLVEQLSKSPWVAKIVVTLNIPESNPTCLPANVSLVTNVFPLGFGANHNQAFALCETPYYCVLNPDIRLPADPFSELVAVLDDPRVGVVGPRVLNVGGGLEDSLRYFLTPTRLIKRYLARDRQESFPVQGDLIFPDWIAGMCMLFRAADYRVIGGFDTNYFMYCEDVDICTRIWGMHKLVVAHANSTVVHDARRASRRSLRHLSWHLVSMMRYWLNNLGNLPNVVAILGVAKSSRPAS
jgi:N-acetylglucosaminyl-diphospho-decaprenol L-rhamnosyltransferase